MGSITGITDSVGNILQEYKYSVFGEIVEQTADSIENYFTYAAREWEPEIGLYYYRNRFYNPSIGRFISEDPLGHFLLLKLSNDENSINFQLLLINSENFAQLHIINSLISESNLYSYVCNCPIIFIDPLGLFGWKGWVGGIAHGYGWVVVLAGGTAVVSTPVGWGLIIGGGALLGWELLSGMEWGEKFGEEARKPIDEYEEKQKKAIEDICK